MPANACHCSKTSLLEPRLQPELSRGHVLSASPEDLMKARIATTDSGSGASGLKLLSSMSARNFRSLRSCDACMGLGSRLAVGEELITTGAIAVAVLF
jgi:hypothetical protein